MPRLTFSRGDIFSLHVAEALVKRFPGTALVLRVLTKRR